MKSGWKSAGSQAWGVTGRPQGRPWKGSWLFLELAILLIIRAMEIDPTNWATLVKYIEVLFLMRYIHWLFSYNSVLIS
jgi:hypothetical protein